MKDENEKCKNETNTECASETAAPVTADKIDVLTHLLELSTSVAVLQRNQQAMEQGITVAFQDIAKSFRRELDAMARALGLEPNGKSNPDTQVGSAGASVTEMVSGAPIPPQ